jgi:hypothetical protein
MSGIFNLTIKEKKIRTCAKNGLIFVALHPDISALFSAQF